MSEGCALVIFVSKEKRKRSDSALWQKPLHRQKNPKSNVTTQRTPPKTSITQRLRTDLGRSAGVTIATQLVCQVHKALKLPKMVRLGKMILAHNCFPVTLIVTKLHTNTPCEWRLCPIDFMVKKSEVKVHCNNTLITENGFGRIIVFPYTYHYEIWNTDSSCVEDLPCWFRVKRS